MAATESRRSAAGRSARRTPELLTGEARYVDDLTLPGDASARGHRPQPVRARADRRRRRLDGAARPRASSPRSPAPTSSTTWPGGAALRLARHRRHEDARRTWPLATDKVRYVGDGVAVVVAESRALAEGRRRARRGRLRAAPGRDRPRGRARRRRAVVHDDARHEPLRTRGSSVPATPTASSPRRPVTVKERYLQQRLIPTRDGAARRARADRDRRGRRTRSGPSTQVPHILRTASRSSSASPRRSCA